MKFYCTIFCKFNTLIITNAVSFKFILCKAIATCQNEIIKIRSNQMSFDTSNYSFHFIYAIQLTDDNDNFIERMSTTQSQHSYSATARTKEIHRENNVTLTESFIIYNVTLTESFIMGQNTTSRIFVENKGKVNTHRQGQSIMTSTKLFNYTTELAGDHDNQSMQTSTSLQIQLKEIVSKQNEPGATTKMQRIRNHNTQDIVKDADKFGNDTQKTLNYANKNDKNVNITLHTYDYLKNSNDFPRYTISNNSNALMNILAHTHRLENSSGTASTINSNETDFQSSTINTDFNRTMPSYSLLKKLTINDKLTPMTNSGSSQPGIFTPIDLFKVMKTTTTSYQYESQSKHSSTPTAHYKSLSTNNSTGVTARETGLTASTVAHLEKYLDISTSYNTVESTSGQLYLNQSAKSPYIILNIHLLTATTDELANQSITSTKTQAISSLRTLNTITKSTLDSRDRLITKLTMDARERSTTKSILNTMNNSRLITVSTLDTMNRFITKQMPNTTDWLFRPTSNLVTRKKHLESNKIDHRVAKTEPEQDLQHVSMMIALPNNDDSFKVTTSQQKQQTSNKLTQKVPPGKKSSHLRNETDTVLKQKNGHKTRKISNKQNNTENDNYRPLTSFENVSYFWIMIIIAAAVFIFIASTASMLIISLHKQRKQRYFSPDQGRENVYEQVLCRRLVNEIVRTELARGRNKIYKTLAEDEEITRLQFRENDFHDCQDVSSFSTLSQSNSRRHFREYDIDSSL